MEIEYKDNDLMNVCTKATEAERKYGSAMADKIALRVFQLREFPTVEEMIAKRVGRCHPLKGNRAGEYAVDLVQPFRLIFEKHGNKIQIAYIKEIKDYH